MSRIPSPRKLLATTTSEIQMPGATTSKGYCPKYCRASCNMVPQSAVGGCTPNPEEAETGDGQDHHSQIERGQHSDGGDQIGQVNGA